MKNTVIWFGLFLTASAFAAEPEDELAALRAENQQLRAEVDRLKKDNQGWYDWYVYLTGLCEKNRIDYRRAAAKTDPPRKKAELVKVPSGATEETVLIPAGDGVLRVDVKSTTVWMASPAVAGGASSPVTINQFLDASLKIRDRVEAQTAGYFNVNGEPCKLEYSGSPEELVSIENDAGAFAILNPRVTFKAVGTVKIRATLAGRSDFFWIEVKQFPAFVGMPSGDLIETLGIPEDKRPVFASWPDNTEIDGIPYHPEAGEGLISAEHWRYDKYPNAVVAVRSGRIAAISTDPTSDKMMQRFKRNVEWRGITNDEQIARLKSLLQETLKYTVPH